MARWGAQAAETPAPTVVHLADLVATGLHQHADETGIRIGGTLHWLHVNSTRVLTHLAWHPKSSQAATAAIDIWPHRCGVRGRASDAFRSGPAQWHRQHWQWEWRQSPRAGAQLIRQVLHTAET